MNYPFGGHNSAHKVYYRRLLFAPLGCVGTLEIDGISGPQTPPASWLSVLSLVTMWPNTVTWHSPMCPWVLTPPTEASPSGPSWPLAPLSAYLSSTLWKSFLSHLAKCWPRTLSSFPVPRRPLQLSHICLAFSENKICVGLGELFSFSSRQLNLQSFSVKTREMTAPLG